MSSEDITLSHEQWLERAHGLQLDTRIFIDGARQQASSTAVFKTTNPWCGSHVATYSECGEHDVEQAVASARHAFVSGCWRNSSASERKETFDRWATLMRTHASELALYDSLEMGMPISSSLVDVGLAADTVEEIAELRQTLPEPSLKIENGVSTTRYEARGVVVAITPWNFPVSQAVARIAPALAMGNSVVLKPSEVATASALRLADLLAEAGLPRGVLNVLTGPGSSTGALLAADRRVALIAFTGSEATGAKIQSTAAQAGIARPMLMELGGKSPVIVTSSFPDPESLGPFIADGVCFNSGQVCAAGSRLVVHEDVADSVIDAVIAAASLHRVGDPLDPRTTMGPLATATQSSRVADFVKRARAAGIPECVGSHRKALPDGVWFFDHVPEDSELAMEEVFGPVLAVSRFRTLDEAVALANHSGHGLVGTVFSGDSDETRVLMESVSAGILTAFPSPVATERPPLSPASCGFEPAGRSGFGCDFGHAGLEALGQRKLVVIAD